METFSKIIDFLNNRFSLPIAIFCSFLLFAPEWILKRLYLLTFVNSNNLIISLVLSFSIILYIYGKGKKLTNYIKTKLEIRSKRYVRRRNISVQVKGLTLEEKAWIFYCLRENIRTLNATEINPTAVALEGKHLVYRPKSVYDRLSTPFTLYPEVWHYLTKKKEIFCPLDKLTDRTYNEKVNMFVKNLKSTGL